MRVIEIMLDDSLWHKAMSAAEQDEMSLAVWITSLIDREAGG